LQINDHSARNKYHVCFLGFVIPCIIIYSNKSTNQMHQYLRFIVCCWSWSVRSDRPRPTALLPPRSNGKPEAATADYKLLMMGMRMPETCWAVFKRQAINLKDWCVYLRTHQRKRWHMAD